MEGDEQNRRQYLAATLQGNEWGFFVRMCMSVRAIHQLITKHRGKSAFVIIGFEAHKGGDYLCVIYIVFSTLQNRIAVRVLCTSNPFH